MREAVQLILDATVDSPLLRRKLRNRGHVLRIKSDDYLCFPVFTYHYKDRPEVKYMADIVGERMCDGYARGTLTIVFYNFPHEIGYRLTPQSLPAFLQFLSRINIKGFYNSVFVGNYDVALIENSYASDRRWWEALAYDREIINVSEIKMMGCEQIAESPKVPPEPSEPQNTCGDPEYDSEKVYIAVIAAGLMCFVSGAFDNFMNWLCKLIK